jgi:hypothetical protein
LIFFEKGGKFKPWGVKEPPHGTLYRVLPALTPIKKGAKGDKMVEITVKMTSDEDGKATESCYKIDDDLNFKYSGKDKSCKITATKTRKTKSPNTKQDYEKPSLKQIGQSRPVNINHNNFTRQINNFIIINQVDPITNMTRQRTYQLPSYYQNQLTDYSTI